MVLDAYRVAQLVLPTLVPSLSALLSLELIKNATTKTLVLIDFVQTKLQQLTMLNVLLT